MFVSGEEIIWKELQDNPTAVSASNDVLWHFVVLVVREDFIIEYSEIDA